MSEQIPTTDLLTRMQVEADTWSVEEPERALWMEAKAEIERLRDTLQSFPLPSQIDGAMENYRRILDWLYKPDGNAALIVDISMKEETPPEGRP